MQIRTDLAVEAHELLREDNLSEIDGIIAKECDMSGFHVTYVEVTNARGAEVIEKPIGKYITISIDRLLRREEDAFVHCAGVVAAQLRTLIPSDKGKSALVVGIGNPNITPDAVGPMTIENLMVTRHMIEKMPDCFARFRPVSAVSPGVLGMTGVETGEMVIGVSERVHPDFIIAIDALASRKMSRVCTTIQISNTGIIPGSGVGNARNAINCENMGVPVIAIGVPTVVDASTLACDLLEASGIAEVSREELDKYGRTMMVTPREIDSRVADIGKLIGYSVNLALHENLTLQDIDMFLS